jgi:adenylate cyclase
VNLAAKLEKHTKAEGVQALTDGATFDLARRQGYDGAPRERRTAHVAGVDGAIDVVVLA